MPKARREALLVSEFLDTALNTAGTPELAGRVPVRPLIVIVGGRLVVDQWPLGVTVAMTSTLIQAPRAFPAVLGADEVSVYELARRSMTWNPTI